MFCGYWYYRCFSYNLGVSLVRSPANTHAIYQYFVFDSGMTAGDKKPVDLGGFFGLIARHVVELISCQSGFRLRSHCHLRLGG
jgi:hypothetical protein